jgi:hypothetical protein
MSLPGITRVRQKWLPRNAVVASSQHWHAMNRREFQELLLYQGVDLARLPPKPPHNPDHAAASILEPEVPAGGTEDFQGCAEGPR